MAKYIPSGSVQTKADFNAEFTKVANAINTQLDRTTATGNQMQADMDMNSNRILNLPEPTDGLEPATKAYVDAKQLTPVAVAEENTYEYVALMLNEAIEAGLTVKCNRYHAGEELVAGLNYYIKTAAQASADGDIIDGYVNHAIINGNVAVLVFDKLHAKQCGAIADGVTLCDDELAAGLAVLLGKGGGDLDISFGTFAISSVLVLPASTGLVGQYRDDAIIRQTVEGQDGVKLSGLNRINHIRIETSNAFTDTDSVGLDVSQCADNLIENLRILYFGFGIKGSGLLWLHSYKKVRIENPRAIGIELIGTDAHLEMNFEDIYVVNNATVGLTNKISYYIQGCKGAFMRNITSDGGRVVGAENYGAVFLTSNIIIDGSHWEAYTLPVFGTTVGVEFESLIRAKGCNLEMRATHVQVAIPTTAAQSALLYAEDSSRFTTTNLVVDSTSKAAYTVAHCGLSNSFGANEMTLVDGDTDLLLAQLGTGAGTARFFRNGTYTKRGSTAGSFAIDVNKIGRIVFTSGTAGTLTGFTGAHSTGQQVHVLYRISGMTVQHGGAFRLQGAVDYSPNINSVQVFEYNADGAFWSEISRNAT